VKQIRDYFRHGEKVQQLIQEQRKQRSPGRSLGAPGLNCLVLGGGGREYAIAWRLARCDSVATIDVVPGNAGVALFSRVIDFSPHDVGRLQQHLAASAIDLAIVGPDELIAEGLGDHLRRASVAVVAPSKEAAKIEWSKTFAKELMTEAHVPTPRWETFTTPEQARNALDRNKWAAPLVVKADGLAAGKGVTICRTLEEALMTLATPPTNSGRVVFEEVLEGEEASRVADELITPIARALAARGTPYRGVIFAGLIRTTSGFKVLEYNARFGDPEAQVTLPRIGGDFAKLMVALGEGRLKEYVAQNPLRLSQRAFVDVVLCAEGYPGSPRVGDRIEGLDALPDGVYGFHGATASTPTGGFITTGGRVMHIVAGGSNIAEARDRAYQGAERVTFTGKFYRSDIAGSGVAVA